MAGLATAFGSGAMTNSVRELEDAKVIFVIGSNMTEAHPVISYFVKRAVKKGAILIVNDPRIIDLTNWATKRDKGDAYKMNSGTWEQEMDA